MIPVDSDDEELSLRLHGSVLGDGPLLHPQTPLPCFLESNPKWGPSLNLRSLFRHIAQLRPRDENNMISLAEHLGNQPELQEGVYQYFKQCRCGDYMFTWSLKRKVTTPPHDAMLNTSEILAGSVSSDMFEIDFSKWAQDMVLALANLCHSTRLFKKTSEAVIFLKSKFNGELSGDHHDGAFCDLSLFNLRLEDMAQEQPAHLRDWASSLGLVVRREHLKPGAFMHHVSHIASFGPNGPLSDTSMEDKVMLCRDLLNRVRRFVSKTCLSPAAFQTLTTTPRVLSGVDVKSFATLFHIPLPSGSPSFEEICTSCTKAGDSVLTNIWYLNDDNRALVKIPEVWYAGIYYHLTYYVMGIDAAREMSTFIKAAPLEQLDLLCDAATEIVRSNCIDVAGFDWLTADEMDYRAFHATLRLYNAFAENSPDLALIKAQVLSFKYHASTEGQGGQFYEVLQSLGMEIVPLRSDFSFEYGPYDGQPFNSSHPRLGPSSVECPRHCMTCAEGVKYLSRHGGFKTTVDLAPVRGKSDSSPDLLFSFVKDPRTPLEVGPNVVIRGPALGSWRSDSYVSSTHGSQFGVDHRFFQSHAVIQSDSRGQDTPLELQQPSINSNWLDVPVPSKPEAPPLSSLHPAFSRQPRGTPGADSVRAGVILGEFLSWTMPAESARAIALKSRVALVPGSTICAGDVILINDPVLLTSRFAPGIHYFGLDEALSVPISALLVVLVAEDPDSWYLKVLCTDIHRTLVSPQSSWPSSGYKTQSSVPLQVLKVSDEAKVLFRDLMSAAVSHGERTDEVGHRCIDNSVEPNPKRPRLDPSLSSPSVPGSAAAPAPTSSQKVPLAAGVFYSKTALAITDRAKFIPFLLSSVPEEILVAATGDGKEFTNSYVMSRIAAYLHSHWMTQIDLGIQQPHFSCLLTLWRQTVFYVHLMDAFPEISIALYQWDWKSSSCLDPKSTLFLDYFLPAENYTRIASVERLYLALSTLNKVFFILFSWRDLLLPFMNMMRPMEGVYDTVCSVGFWLNRTYSMLFRCSQAALNKLNHGPLIPPGQNELLLRNIIAAAANMPFDHASNLKFNSEEGYRVKLAAPLSFTKSSGKPSSESKPSSPSPDNKPIKSTGTKGSPGVSTPTSPGLGRDFSQFEKAGVDLPPKVNAPAHLLCIMDLMGTYKLSFDNNQSAKCNKRHDVRSGLRNSTRLHYDEILTSYPARYNLASALYQACFWLNDKPFIAAKVMKAIQADKDHFK